MPAIPPPFHSSSVFLTSYSLFFYLPRHHLLNSSPSLFTAIPSFIYFSTFISRAGLLFFYLLNHFRIFPFSLLFLIHHLFLFHLSCSVSINFHPLLSNFLFIISYLTNILLFHSLFSYPSLLYITIRTYPASVYFSLNLLPSFLYSYFLLTCFIMYTLPFLLTFLYIIEPFPSYFPPQPNLIFSILPSVFFPLYSPACFPFPFPPPLLSRPSPTFPNLQSLLFFFLTQFLEADEKCI